MTSQIATLALALLLLFPAFAAAQDVEAVTILIDSLTTLPVATGLAADSAADNFVVMAQGERQLFGDFPLFDFGWDPSGLIRLMRGGQLQMDRPYGCLMGMFNTSLNYFYYFGDGGAFPEQIDDYGWELQLTLNMSASDHAMASGRFVVTLLRVPAGFPAQQANVVIDATTSLPVSTGLVASAGDRFLVRTRGAIRPPVPGVFNDGWFDPSGRARLDRLGQLQPSVPYGSLLGEFSGAGLFNIGDGGTWDAQPVDLGQPLLLHLNMSAADQAAMEGRLVVTVNRFPDASLTGVPAPDAGRTLEVGKSAPNPTPGPTTIAYSARVPGRVLARVYDGSGRSIRTLADAQVPAGDHRLEWDGRDASGARVAPGVYFCQLSFEDRSETRNISVVR
jgi:hypothetical protein